MQMSINLTVSHLRGVVALADCGTFTAAARSLGLAQSALSRTIADAEQRLNVSLFVRTTRSVHATADGREVAEHARRILLGFDAGMRDIESFLTGDRGSVSIACLPSLAATFLPPHVLAFRQANPGVRVSIKDGLLANTLAEVRAGTVDMAVVATTGPLAGLNQEPIGTDSFYCSVPRTHRFALRASVGWQELAGEAFIAFGPDSSIESIARRALADAGAQLGSIIPAENVGAVAGLVAAGLGITAVPGMVLPMMQFADLAHIPLTPTVTRNISIAYLPGQRQTACTRAFIEVLRAARA